jgi:hypothetical protein
MASAVKKYTCQAANGNAVLSTIGQGSCACSGLTCHRSHTDQDAPSTSQVARRTIRARAGPAIRTRNVYRSSTSVR